MISNNFGILNFFNNNSSPFGFQAKKVYDVIIERVYLLYYQKDYKLYGNSSLHRMSNYRPQSHCLHYLIGQACLCNRHQILALQPATLLSLPQCHSPHSYRDKNVTSFSLWLCRYRTKIHIYPGVRFPKLFFILSHYKFIRASWNSTCQFTVWINEYVSSIARKRSIIVLPFGQRSRDAGTRGAGGTRGAKVPFRFITADLINCKFK